MVFSQLLSLVSKTGFTLKDVPLNFVGLRKKDVKANRFEDLFYVIFKGFVISLSADTSTKASLDKVYAFQKLYNALSRIQDCTEGLLAVDGSLGPITRDALDLYNDCYTGGKEMMWSFEITTRSGIPYLLKPLNSKGTAMLTSPGVHKYVRGLHKGQQAFVQGEPFTVYRDDNRNNTSEKTKVLDKGYFGINIHRRRLRSISDWIGKWSAGCQVFRYAQDLRGIIQLSDALIQFKRQFVFPYTLIDEE